MSFGATNGRPGRGFRVAAMPRPEAQRFGLSEAISPMGSVIHLSRLRGDLLPGASVGSLKRLG